MPTNTPVRSTRFTHTLALGLVGVGLAALAAHLAAVFLGEVGLSLKTVADQFNLAVRGGRFPL